MHLHRGAPRADFAAASNKNRYGSMYRHIPDSELMTITYLPTNDE